MRFQHMVALSVMLLGGCEELSGPEARRMAHPDAGVTKQIAIAPSKTATPATPPLLTKPVQPIITAIPLPILRPVAAEAAVAEPHPDFSEETAPVSRELTDAMTLGKRRAKRGEIIDAIAAFDSAVKMEPKSPLPHIELARLFIAENDLRAASEHADVAVALAPRSSAAWNTKGRVMLLSRNPAGAAAAFGRAVKEDPDNVFAWNNLGLAHMAMEKWDDAVAAFEKATDGEDVEAYMWSNLAGAYERQNRIVEARTAYQEAVDRGSASARGSLMRLDSQDTARAHDSTPR